MNPKFTLPDLYCLTASKELSRGRDNLTLVKEMIQSGVKLVQYREKDLSGLQKYRECLEIRKLTMQEGVTFIVNDDIDIALAVKADGIHIGQDDLPIEQARKLVGPGMIIGLSTHSPDQARDAIARGADYIGVGPVFPTQTKKNVCAAVGTEYLDFVVKNINIPFVAIGGIKEHNIDIVLKHGAQCIALVTEITGAENISETIGRIRKRFKHE